MHPAPKTFAVAGVPFAVALFDDEGHLVASLSTGSVEHALLADALTAMWKLDPVGLSESLASREAVTLFEFFTIIYEGTEEAPRGFPGRSVLIHDGDEELRVAEGFFDDVVRGLAAAYFAGVREDQVPWVERLSPAARTALGMD